MLLLDLDACSPGYCPTEFQRSTFPTDVSHKLRVIFDGIERSVYRGHKASLRPPISERRQRVIAGVTIPPTMRIVTYVSSRSLNRSHASICS